MKISTLKRKIQKIGSEVESLLQKIDNLLDEIEDDDVCDMLGEISEKFESAVEDDIPQILDYIDENLNIEETNED
jgi:predicted nuclease with TOPRIM domain